MATRQGTRKRRPLRERFWEKVLKRGPDDCWEWTAGGTSKGYGVIGEGGGRGKILLAHRVSWEIHNGPIPAGLCVLHDCDNPPCCNPEHLFTGTHADNRADMLAKGRGAPASGEAHGMSKLTAAKVREMRREHAAGGVTYEALGFKYGTNPVNAWRVITGKTWRNVT